MNSCYLHRRKVWFPNKFSSCPILNIRTPTYVVFSLYFFILCVLLKKVIYGENVKQLYVKAGDGRVFIGKNEVCQIRKQYVESGTNWGVSLLKVVWKMCANIR